MDSASYTTQAGNSFMSTNNNVIDTTQTLLVGIEMGLPRKGRKLKDVAAKAEKEANASAGTTRATLNYWTWTEGKTERNGLKSLQEFQASYKAALEHFARFPMATGRLLPAALAEPFFKVKAEFAAQEPDIREKFAYEEYPALAKSAPQRMGSFYSGADFPTLAECLERFVCEITVIPLAPAEQVKAIGLLSPDIAATIEKSTNESYHKGKAEAHRDLWTQVMEPIQHAVDTLSKDKTKIYDSLVGNIISIVDLIPAYNGVFNDPHLNQLAEQAKAAFSAIKPDDLRASQEAKAAMLENAKNIVNTFKPYARKLAV
jgi:hypothetical protein